MITISPEGAIALDRVPTEFSVERDAELTVVKRGKTALPLMFSQYDLGTRRASRALVSRDSCDARGIAMFETHFREALFRFIKSTEQRLQSPTLAAVQRVVATYLVEQILAMDPAKMDVPLSNLQLKIAKDAVQNARFLAAYLAAGHTLVPSPALASAA